MTGAFRVGLALAALSFAILLSGCGDEAASDTVVPVSGTVTLNGEPVAGASVTFVAAATTAGQGGVGVTDASGKYEVTHFRAGKGVEPGEYRVVVSKLVMQDGSPIPAGTDSAADLATKDAIPLPYSSYDDSPLKATVTKGGQPVDFALVGR